MPRLDPVSVAGVGDNVVDCYIDAGLMFPGGNTVNVAAFAARFGARAAYLGQVAADPAGDTIASGLHAEGVDVSRLRRAEGRTAHCIIAIDSNGDRQFVSSELGVSRFTLSDQDLEALRAFDAAHVGATSGLDAQLEELAAVTCLSYDFAIHGSPEHVARVGPSCFLAIHSGGDLDDDGFEALVQRSERSGAEWSLVTRGTRGAVLSHGGMRWRGDAVVRSAAVDTLGAGDTFAARVLVGLLRGEEPRSLLAAAAVAAAETCAHLGAFGHGAPLDLPILTQEPTR